PGRHGTFDPPRSLTRAGSSTVGTSSEEMPMSYRVAVNGFGRIGRNYVRCVLERGLLERGIQIVGVNDLWAPATLAHLLQNDTTFGRLRWDVDHDAANIRVGGASIPT